MTEHLPECPKSGCAACYEQGKRDAIAAAVQRVEALAKEWEEQTLAVKLAIGIALAAVKGQAERQSEEDTQ